VQNFDPQLGIGINPNRGTQYPVIPYSQNQLAPVFPNQSTLPQLQPGTPGMAGLGPNGLPNGVTNVNPPAMTICPSGAPSFNGLC
jgi:hypothetical protein